MDRNWTTVRHIARPCMTQPIVPTSTAAVTYAKEEQWSPWNNNNIHLSCCHRLSAWRLLIKLMKTFTIIMPQGRRDTRPLFISESSQYKFWLRINYTGHCTPESQQTYYSVSQGQMATCSCMYIPSKPIKKLPLPVNLFYRNFTWQEEAWKICEVCWLLRLMRTCMC